MSASRGIFHYRPVPPCGIVKFTVQRGDGAIAALLSAADAMAAGSSFIMGAIVGAVSVIFVLFTPRGAWLLHAPVEDVLEGNFSGILDTAARRVPEETVDELAGAVIGIINELSAVD